MSHKVVASAGRGTYNQLRAMLEDQLLIASESKSTLSSENIALQAYIQTLALMTLTVGSLDNAGVVANTEEMVSLMEGCKVVVRELQRGFVNKRKTQRYVLQRRQSRADTYHERDKQKYWNEIRPYFSLTKEEIVKAYLEEKPENFEDAGKFANIVDGIPLLRWFLTPENVQKHVRDRKDCCTDLTPLLSQATSSLCRNFLQLTHAALPLYRVLYSTVSSAPNSPFHTELPLLSTELTTLHRPRPRSKGHVHLTDTYNSRSSILLQPQSPLFDPEEAEFVGFMQTFLSEQRMKESTRPRTQLQSGSGNSPKYHRMQHLQKEINTLEKGLSALKKQEKRVQMDFAHRRNDALSGSWKLFGSFSSAKTASRLSSPPAELLSL